MKTLDTKSMNSLKGGGLIGTLGRWAYRVLRDGFAYDCVKTVVQNYEHDPSVNYTPWYGPGGGGFK